MATGLRVKIVEKLITARIERPDEDGNFLARGYDLFAMKLRALKFRGGRVVVAHDELDFDTRGYLNLARNELVIFQHNRKAGIIRQGGRYKDEKEHHHEPGGKTHCNTPVAMRMRTLLIIARMLIGKQAQITGNVGLE